MDDVAKVLIVDDNEEVVESLTLALKLRWPEATVISTDKGEKGVEIIETQCPDVCVLDLGLPDISGFEVLKRVRQFSFLPIIILSVRGEEKDIFTGLELGAHDYIVKPFRQLELLARIKAQVRRHNNCEHKQPLISGSFRLNPAEHTVSYRDQNIHLTQTECIILAHLMANAGRIVSHDNLTEELWGNNNVDSASSLKVYICRLRQKLEPNPEHPVFLITKPGLGYLFAKTS